MTPDNHPQIGINSPISPNESLLASEMGSLHRTLVQGATDGNLPPDKQWETEAQLIRYTSRVIYAKHDAAIGKRPDTLGAFNLTQDGIHAIITTPPTERQPQSFTIRTPISSLSKYAQEELPPLDEEAVVAGLRRSEEQIGIKYKRWGQMPGDETWEAFNRVRKERSLRMIAVVKGKAKGELPNIGVVTVQDGEGVLVILPSNVDGGVPLQLTSHIGSLMDLDPESIESFQKIPSSPVEHDA